MWGRDVPGSELERRGIVLGLLSLLGRRLGAGRRLCAVALALVRRHGRKKSRKAQEEEEPHKESLTSDRQVAKRLLMT